jgi:hypothetical protein
METVWQRHRNQMKDFQMVYNFVYKKQARVNSSSYFDLKEMHNPNLSGVGCW